MPNDLSPRILIAAAVGLLIDALEQDSAAQLATPNLLRELRGLEARVAAELEERAGRRGLRLADEPDESNVSDD